MKDELQKPVKKRFIAGAVCPRCSEMDKVINYHEDGKNYRECVACGFMDEIRLQSPPQEPATRLREENAEEVEVQAVKILQP